LLALRNLAPFEHLTASPLSGQVAASTAISIAAAEEERKNPTVRKTYLGNRYFSPHFLALLARIRNKAVAAAVAFHIHFPSALVLVHDESLCEWSRVAAGEDLQLGVQAATLPATSPVQFNRQNVFSPSLNCSFAISIE
jgi:hypothetical protein